MKNRNKITSIGKANEGEWLYSLLADIREDVAAAPKPESIARIRARLIAEMDTPVRVAA